MPYIFGPYVINRCKQNSSRNKNFKKQKSAIRAIAGLKFNDHTEPHFFLTGNPYTSPYD